MRFVILCFTLFVISVNQLQHGYCENVNKENIKVLEDWNTTISNDDGTVQGITTNQPPKSTTPPSRNKREVCECIFKRYGTGSVFISVITGWSDILTQK